MNKALMIGATAGAICALAVVLAAGEYLSKPAPAILGEAPVDLQARVIHFPSPAGAIAGWLSAGRPGHGAVLLLHGVRGNRSAMLARARFLHAQGFGVLLVDLPAHGESGGTRMTFGAREKDAVLAALAFLHAQLPGEKIGVIGQSLGAAAMVLAYAAPPAGAVMPDAVVLESMYPTIEEAVADRLHMRLGRPGTWLAPLLLLQLPLRTGVWPAALRPIAVIGAIRVPVMIISGGADQQTTAAETQRIFDAVQGSKSLWLMEGAGHIDLHEFAAGEYERRVGQFLTAALR